MHAALHIPNESALLYGREQSLTLMAMCSYASTFQMLRGTLVLWAGLLTIVLLHRRLHIHNWFGMVLIVAGAAIVGASRSALSLNASCLHHKHKSCCHMRTADLLLCLCSIIYDRKNIPSKPPSLAGSVQVCLSSILHVSGIYTSPTSPRPPPLPSYDSILMTTLPYLLTVQSPNESFKHA